MNVTLAAFRRQLAAGDLGPLYVLVGADDSEKSAVAGEIAETVDEGLRAFNIDRLYGGETTVDEVIEVARTFPMMVPRRVIIVLQAEKLLAPKRDSKAADAAQERLEAFLQAPPPHATVVFVCGALDMRRRVVKILLKEARTIDCGTIEDQADAEKWVQVRAARLRAPLDAGAVRALVHRAGLDVVRLRAGLDRVALYALGQPTITADDVRESVPAGPDVQADFGIAKAIWRNDAREALNELGLALEAGAVPFMVMGQLRAAAEKLPAPRVESAIDAVFRADIALKTSAGDPRTLLERLVVELCPNAVRRGRAT